MITEHIDQWVKSYPLSAIDIDCVTTVMLKIIDGKCKMREEEKHVMRLLYDQVKNTPGKLLDSEVHTLIETARASEIDDQIRATVYEKRVLAETMISRPVMKKFKAMIRENGLLNLQDSSI